MRATLPETRESDDVLALMQGASVLRGLSVEFRGEHVKAF